MAQVDYHRGKAGEAWLAVIGWGEGSFVVELGRCLHLRRWRFLQHLHGSGHHLECCVEVASHMGATVAAECSDRGSAEFTGGYY